MSATARRQLSSDFTFYRQAGTPLVWLLMICTFFSIYEFSFEIWSLLLLFFALLLIIVVGFVTFDNFRLKDADFDDDALYVSNFFKEVRIPFDAIEEVKLRKLRCRELIVVSVRLRTACEFGQEILVEPIWKWSSWSSPERQTWEELKRLTTPN